MKITYDQLVKHEACKEQRLPFKETFGNEVEITEEVCKKYYAHFDFRWVVRNLFPKKLCYKYVQDCVSLECRYREDYIVLYNKYKQDCNSLNDKYKLDPKIFRDKYLQECSVLYNKYSQNCGDNYYKLLRDCVMIFYRLSLTLP